MTHGNWVFDFLPTFYYLLAKNTESARFFNPLIHITIYRLDRRACHTTTMFAIWWRLSRSRRSAWRSHLWSLLTFCCQAISSRKLVSLRHSAPSHIKSLCKFTARFRRCIRVIVNYYCIGTRGLSPFQTSIYRDLSGRGHIWCCIRFRLLLDITWLSTHIFNWNSLRYLRLWLNLTDSGTNSRKELLWAYCGIETRRDYI